MLSAQKSSYDTPLHALLRTCKSVDEIQKFIDTNDHKSIAEMAKTVNERGELPIFMIYSLPFSHKEQLEAQTLLLSFSKTDSYEPLGPLQDKPILDKYSHLKDTPIYENIELGVKAIQAVRAEIKEASTHIEVNDIDESKRNEIGQKIKALRKKFDAEKLIERKKNEHLPPSQQKIQLITHQATFFLKEKAANCYELSYATLYQIHLLNDKKAAGVWYIGSDDHVVVIIEPDTPHAVFCDALTGNVFPGKELLTQLNSYYCIDTESSFVNLYAKFNPEFHYLKEEISLSENKTIPDQCLTPFVCPYKTNPITIEDQYINKPYVDGITALCYAAKENAQDFAKNLLDRKADPDIKGTKGITPLIKAAEIGSTAITQLLLDSNAKMELTDNSGTTPLISAVKKGNIKTATLLLERKADPNHGRYDGAAPLFFVPDKNQKEIIRLLLDHKADINQTTASNRTPLMNAVFAKSLSQLEYLLETKADPNISKTNGLTALYMASYYGLADHVKLLLQYKADPSIKYLNTHTALWTAKEYNKKEVVTVLEEYEKSKNLSLQP